MSHQINGMYFEKKLVMKLIENLEKKIVVLRNNIIKSKLKFSVSKIEIEDFIRMSMILKFLREAKLNSDKGTSYFYYANLLYKEAFKVIKHIELEGIEEALAIYKEINRKSISPSFLSLCNSWDFIGNWAVGSKDNTQSLFCLTGDKKGENYLKVVPSIKHDYIKVQKSSGWGVFNGKMEEILPFKYNSIRVDELGPFACYIDNKWEFTINNPCENISVVCNSSEGLIGVKSEKWGFSDRRGNLLIPLEYDDVKSFKFGLCAVKKDNKWGYIDKNNKTKIPFIFDDASSFKLNTIAIVKLQREDYFINIEGEKILKSSEILNNLFDKC